MHSSRKAPSKPAAEPKPKAATPAIRLDDLIPSAKVLGGRRIVFGVRMKPDHKSQP